MPLPIYFTQGAERDLYAIYDYVADHDSPKKADDLLDKFQKLIAGLSDSAERGAIPKELLNLGIREYRQLYFKPYRIIYRCVEKKVMIYMVADGRRDMQTLLERRLLSQ